MNHRLSSLLIALALAAQAVPAAAHRSSGASELSALSMLPVAVSVAAPVALLVSGAALTVVAVEAASDGTVWILERASDGARASVTLGGAAVGGVSVAAGAVVVVHRDERRLGAVDRRQGHRLHPQRTGRPCCTTRGSRDEAPVSSPPLPRPCCWPPPRPRPARTASAGRPRPPTCSARWSWPSARRARWTPAARRWWCWRAPGRTWALRAALVAPGLGLPRRHAGPRPVWRVVHKLNQCGSGRRAVPPGPGRVLPRRPARYVAAYAVPTRRGAAAPAAAAAGQRPRGAAAHRGLQHGGLPLGADLPAEQPVGDRDAGPGRWSPISGHRRDRAQAWLRFKGYQPSTLHISALTRLGARVSAAHIAFDDHPATSALPTASRPSPSTRCSPGWTARAPQPVRPAGQRRFAPFFWVQFLGAGNDNLFKFAFTVMVTYQLQVSWLPPRWPGW
jgi:hypothetical protein